ncbi:MAG: ATP-binding protein [Pseudomonadota bacterium]
MRLWPRRLAGQLTLAIIAVLVAAQAITLFLLVDERRVALRALSQRALLTRTTTIVRLINETPAAYHTDIVRSASSPQLRFWLSRDAALKPMPKPANPRLDRVLRRQLGDSARASRVAIADADADDVRRLWRAWRQDIRQTRRGGRNVRRESGPPRQPANRGQLRTNDPRRALQIAASVLPANGERWLNVETVVPAPAPPWTGRLLVVLTATGVLTILLVVLLVRRAMRPLGELSEAAERFGTGDHSVVVAERGPEDVRATIRAFNTMRTRLVEFVQSRTRMLAAVSHDLRTPLTSMRLRAEMVDDERIREKLCTSLEEMQEMVEATLSFVREDASSEAAQDVQLDTLVETVCADFRDMGADVATNASSGLIAHCRPLAMRRALRNIIENALKYGHFARVDVASVSGSAAISVTDGGPGIPDDALERVLQPFVRIEESRSRATGGIGMGLAIAQSIMKSHGGELAIENLDAGLKVSLRLPV